MTPDEPAAPGEFRPIDPKVVTVWRIVSAITLAFVLLALLVPAGLATSLGGVPLAATALGYAAVAAVAGFLAFWFPRRAYLAYGYRIDEKVLEIRNGVVVRLERLLPLSRLQHVDVKSGPVERAFGLATLVLYTAGTHEAVLRIPGLAAGDAVRLRDRLVAIGGDDAV